MRLMTASRTMAVAASARSLGAGPDRDADYDTLQPFRNGAARPPRAVRRRTVLHPDGKARLVPLQPPPPHSRSMPPSRCVSTPAGSRPVAHHDAHRRHSKPRHCARQHALGRKPLSRAGDGEPAQGRVRVAVRNEAGVLKAALFLTRSGTLPPRDWILAQLGPGAGRTRARRGAARRTRRLPRTRRRASGLCLLRYRRLHHHPRHSRAGAHQRRGHRQDIERGNQLRLLPTRHRKAHSGSANRTTGHHSLVTWN
jgi:hypothetical protein